MPMPQIDLTEIQGNVLVAYAFPLARYCFCRIDDSFAARQSLTHLIPLITTSELWDGAGPSVTTNVAFSFQGLRKLDLPQESLNQFPLEFQEGMQSRAHLLNDVRKNSPENWDPVWRDGAVHMLITLNAVTSAALDARFSEVHHLLKTYGGIVLLGQQDAAALEIDGKLTSKEHFGYTDGIGNPDIGGAGLKARPGRGKPMPDGKWAPIETGEFVLGYPDEAGEIPPAPEPKLLSKNGSFLVYRKLHQNVATFRNYLEAQGKKYPGGKAQLAAKFVGRWQDGTPLALSPDEMNPTLAADSMRNNDFSYDDDPVGANVPLGAHIRRMNPRESFGLGGKIANRHRIARRGLPYGKWCPYDQQANDTDEHGVIFMIINASIKRQFEFVWQQWANYGNDFQQGNDRDPIAGNQSGTGKMVVQGDPDNPEDTPAFVCPDLPQFVEVRGGEYFFVPSITALDLIAEGIVAERLSNLSASTSPRRIAPLPIPDSAPLADRDVDEPDPNFFRWLLSLPLSLLTLLASPLVAFLKAWALNHPRTIFWLLRQFKPVLNLGKIVLVSRYDDVVKILTSDHTFHVTYGDQMRQITAGENFFLGMQPSAQYTLNVTNMRNVVRPDDIPRHLVAPLEVLAEKIVASAGGELDVVQQLGMVGPPTVIAEYFGTPMSGLAGFADKASLMFRYIFIPDNPEDINKRALDGAAAMRTYIDQVIAQRKAQPTQPDDVLARCLKMQADQVPGMDDLGIRNNFVGLIVGAVPTISKCAAQALDQLLARPAMLAAAQQAARQGDDDLLSRYVFEALRFNPNNPGLLRKAVVDVPMGSNWFGPTVIKKGQLVMALSFSAMFDERRVDSPNDFRIDRPATDYLHFGTGMHECFGRYISRALIPLVLKPVLRQVDLRRADGPAGQLQMDGPFPSSLVVKFQPPPTAPQEPK